MSTTEQAGLDAAAVAAGFGDLPTLAPVAVEVLRLAADDRASLEDIAAVISRDPGLAGQMLRVANSPMYGMGGETTSLARAASVLGLRTVKLLSLSFSVLTRPAANDPAATRLWRHTLSMSAMARSLAQTRDPRVADECFIAALLANTGRVALADAEPYRVALDGAGGWLDADAERASIGFTSDEVSRLVLAGWGLPGVLGDAVQHRADPEAAEGVTARVATILAVADAAACLIVAAEDEAAGALERYRAQASRLLDLTEEEVDDVLVEAEPALSEIASMFQTDAPNVEPIGQLLLRAKDGLARLSLDMVAQLSQQETRFEHLENENERLATEAATDVLTGLPNRRSYDDFLDRTIAGRLRHPSEGAMGLLLMDLDHFKSINDTHGHQAGDDVLRGVGARLSLHTRRDEFAARIGGEEFVVVVPLAAADELPLAAERYRNAIAAEPFETCVGPLDVTVSIGVAGTEELGDTTAGVLYEAADAALYDAKNGGRNRFCVAD